MENFIVSARKYRPVTFDTVVGQSSITTTLKNAIKNQHLAQAFLFCGPRGVGKTTCARILAKTINCENITDKTEACDKCESCKSFNTSHSLNIYELDAASNNSVDDIRNLVDQVRFAPPSGKYKIYIIDEVHMLSQSAFNAFLKTLEEPPSYAIFILATTEKHKIIPTILSRCQIFDFNRIRVEDIAKHLQFIAGKEGIKAEEEALHIIAQKADGALRDALSMFDQIVSFCGNTVSYKAVIENLNILDYDYYFKITDNILKGNISASLLIYNDILSHGFDGHNFINGISEHFRDLLVCKDEATLKLLEVSDSIREKYKAQGAQCPVSFLLAGLDVLGKADAQYKSMKNQRLHVELTLMKLCSLLAASDPAKKKTEYSPPPVPSVKAAEPVETVPRITPQPAPAARISVPVQDPKKQPPLSKTVSIKNGLNSQNGKTNGNGASKDPSVPKNELKESFSEEALLLQWKKYADSVASQGKQNLFITLSKNNPVLREDYRIEFSVDNKVQEEELNLEKTDFLEFLRNELRNTFIMLSVIVKDKQDSTSTTLYTSRDKFRRMAENNPNLNELRKQLDLEIDY